MSTDLAAEAGGPDDAYATVAGTADRGSRIASVVITFGWHLAINLPAVLTDSALVRLPWVTLVGWLLFAAVGGYTSVCLLRNRPYPVWPLVGVLLLIDAAVFAVTPGALLFHPINWCWGTLGWFAVLVLWGRRVGALVTVLAAGAGIALVAMLTAGDLNPPDLSRYVMYVYGTASLPIILLVGTAALRALAGGTARATADRAAIEAERAAAARVHTKRRGRMATLSRTAGAVLAELASGRADPTDPTVQQRCALEASRLRRLIAESDDVPDPLLHELRACVDVAERNGLSVELIAVGSLPALPVEVRRRLAEPLTTALATARQWARLTVVGQPDEVAVSLTTPSHSVPTAEAVNDGADTNFGAGMEGDIDADGVEYSYERDGELVWAQTRWRAT